MNFFFKDRKFPSLILLLIVKAMLLTIVILFAGIGLGPDEAQYWTWSKALDWGYYSKPPGIAWQIALGTQYLGETELGVRAVSMVLAFFQALLIYFMALQARLSSQLSFWCALMMAFVPIGILGSFFAITDVGFLFCWTGACFTLLYAFNHSKEPNPLIVGSWILCGALFKWPIYLFWIFFIVARYSFFKGQSLYKLFAGIGISFIGLFPALWWNWTHDWATFKHVFSTVQGGSSHKAAGNFFDFLGSQILLLSPLIFALLIFSLWKWIKMRKNLTPSIFFCGFITISSLGIMLFVSCFQKIQGNWITFAYPTGIILIGWAFQNLRLFWLKLGIASSIGLTFIFFLIPISYHFSLPSLSYKLNPLKHNMGWNALEEGLKKEGYDPAKHFLASDKYQTTSILSFYSEGQKRAYFLNLNGIRNNQFTYWPDLMSDPAKVGFFVLVENLSERKNWEEKGADYQRKLQPYFEKVQLVSIAPLIVEKGKTVKAALIFNCTHCIQVPSSTSLY